MAGATYVERGFGMPTTSLMGYVPPSPEVAFAPPAPAPAPTTTESIIAGVLSPFTTQLTGLLAPLAKIAVPAIAGLAGGGLATMLGGDSTLQPVPGGNGGAPAGMAPEWFVGPGLREPPAQYVVKEWKIRLDSKQGDFNLQFYRLVNGTVWMYNQRTREWSHWRPYKMAVIGKKLPKHQTLARLRRYLNKHSDDAVTILKLTKPYKLKAYRGGDGYRYHTGVYTKRRK